MLDDTPTAMKAKIGWLAYELGATRHLRDRPMRLHTRLDYRPSISTHDGIGTAVVIAFAREEAEVRSRPATSVGEFLVS
jgi:hypothetical protein